MNTPTQDVQGFAACRQILAFFLALDERRHDDVAAMMAHDGVWHRQGVALTGPAAVAQALAARSPARETAHIITNQIADFIGPGHVRVAFYLTAYESRTDGSPSDLAPRLVSIRSCVDELVETPAGWRIVKKTSRPHLPPAPASTAR